MEVHPLEEISSSKARDNDLTLVIIALYAQVHHIVLLYAELKMDVFS